MATVTGVTKQRLNSVEDQLIISAAKEGRNLTFSLKGGQKITLTGVFQAPYEFYPVGSIYMSTVSTNPASPSMLGGGTWQRWGQGRVPVSVEDTSNTFTNAPDVKSGVRYFLNPGGLELNIVKVPSVDDPGGFPGFATGPSVFEYITCYMWKRIA